MSDTARVLRALHNYVVMCRGVCAGKDIIGIQRALEMYEDIDVNFSGSRESELLKVRRSCLTPFLGQ